ncbi:MAG: ABC transporter substrate-binding protein [Candidatus Thiodiazotropha sp.]|jgi:ABC-type transport system substrate-binding protein
MVRIASYVLSVGLVIFFATALSSCSKENTTSSQLVVGIDTEPERFDPLTMKNPKNFIVSWQIFEGLLSLDSKGQIVPMLAESWETADNQTWRFHIRKGVRFHDAAFFGSSGRGRELTAEDVVSSYTSFCSASAYPAFLLMDSIAGCADYNIGKATSVEGIQQVDRYTVDIRLLQPEPFFLNRLTTAWIAIYPLEANAKENRDNWGLQTAVGTGPYRLVSRSDSEIVLEHNEDYWGKFAENPVSQIVFRVIKSDPVRLAEFEKGRIDMMLVPYSLFPQILDSGGSVKAKYANRFRSQSFATFNIHMLGFNLNQVPDVHLRRAMSLGFDRQQIVDHLFSGLADITLGAVPPGMNGYVSPLTVEASYDPEQARVELSKSGYKEGAAVELLVHEQAGSEQIGQLFQSQMKEFGIDVKLTKLDFNSVLGRMVKGDAQMFSMYFDYVLSSPEPVLINLFSSPKQPVPNFWQFSDPETDSLLESLRTVPRSEAKKVSAEIERRVADQAPAIFLFRLRQMALYSSRFDGLTINPHGFFAFQSMTTAEK